MPDVILVVVDRPRAVSSQLDAAGHLAKLLGDARVEVLAVHIPAEATILPTEEILTTRRKAEWEAAERLRLEALHGSYLRWQADGGEAARRSDWRIEEGDPDAVVAEHGRRCDYLVIARPADREGESSREIGHAALFETSRPVLVVPETFRGTFGRRVAIAFKDDGRADKAILAAMPLLGKAEQVCVFIGARDDMPAPAVPDILTEHAIPATLCGMLVGERGTFGAALLAAVTEGGHDMLVMGAYAHSPWRELFLGGVTRHVLAAANIPVLMRH